MSVFIVAFQFYLYLLFNYHFIEWTSWLKDIKFLYLYSNSVFKFDDKNLYLKRLAIFYILIKLDQNGSRLYFQFLKVTFAYITTQCNAYVSIAVSTLNGHFFLFSQRYTHQTAFLKKVAACIACIQAVVRQDYLRAR